jgi:hypothetical protein
LVRRRVPQLLQLRTCQLQPVRLGTR